MALSPILPKPLHAELPAQGQAKKYSTPTEPAHKHLFASYFALNPLPGTMCRIPPNNTNTPAK